MCQWQVKLKQGFPLHSSHLGNHIPQITRETVLITTESFNILVAFISSAVRANPHPSWEFYQLKFSSTAQWTHWFRLTPGFFLFHICEHRLCLRGARCDKATLRAEFLLSWCWDSKASWVWVSRAWCRVVSSPCHAIRPFRANKTWPLGVFADSLAPVSSSGSFVWRCAVVCPRRSDLQIVLNDWWLTP